MTKTLSVLHQLLKKSERMVSSLQYPRLVHAFFKYLVSPIAFDRDTRFNRGLRFGFLRTGGGTWPVADLKAFRHYYEALQQNLEALLVAAQRDEPLVWTEWALTREILDGFGVPSVSPDLIVAMTYSISSEAAVAYLEKAEHYGIATEDCSSQKGGIGAFLSGDLPRPAAIIAASHPCDSGVSLYQVMEYLTGAPVWMLDTPYYRNADSLRYYANQLRELIAFLEQRLERPFDWARFKRSVVEFNTFNSYLYEIGQMGRAVPCPYSVEGLRAAWALRSLATGCPAATEFARQLYRNAKQRLDEGRGVIDKERIRVLWWDVPVTFTEIAPWMAREFGAVCLTDFISLNPHFHIDTSSENTMIDGLALAHMYHGMRRQCHGPAEYVTDELQALIDEFSPDCLIFARHSGCKHLRAMDKIIADTCERSGLPTLFLSVDIFDPRDASENEIKESIARFFHSNGLA